MKQIFHAYILNTEFNAADTDMRQFISDVLGKEINPDDLSLEPDLIILEKRKERKNIIDADVEAAMRSLELKANSHFAPARCGGKHAKPVSTTR